MTAVASNSNGWAPIASSSSPIPISALVPLQASKQVGRGQFMTYDSSGNAALNDGATPNLISAGVAYPEIFSDQSTVAGAAKTMAYWGFGSGPAASTIASDSFSASDIGTPFYIVDENTPGKLSNYSGSNRSLGGLVFGLDKGSNPIVWSGPVAQLVARATLITNSCPFAWYTIADGSAGATTAERAIPTTKFHGLVTSVEFVGAAVAADNSDYVTITIKKYVLADDYASGLTVATYDSRAANQGAIAAFTPAAFALSGTAAYLNKLETDRYTITVAKGGSGKVLTGEILVNGKAI